MIENLRKYTGLIIVVVILVFLGLVFFFDSGALSQRGGGGGGTYIQVDARSYSRADFTNRAVSPMQLAQSLPSYDRQNYDANGFEVLRFVSTLSGGAQDSDALAQRFFAGRIKLGEARDQFGVHPSNEEVAEFVQALGRFKTNGEFDQAKYNQFVQRGIGYLGLTEPDFQDLIRDVIAARTLRQLVGGGLAGSRSLAEAQSVLNAQKVEVETAALPMDSFKEAVDRDDETLKAYWEEVKDGFQTEKRVKVSYFIAAPAYPDEESEPKEDDAGEAPVETETEEEPPLKDEAKSEEEEEEEDEQETVPTDETAAAPAETNTPEQNAEPTEEEKKAKEEAEKKRLEERLKAEKSLAMMVDEFLTDLETADGEGFKKLVEQRGWEVVSTDWFTQSTIPAELKISPRGTSIGKQVGNLIFSKLTLESDPLARFTEGLAVGQNQWLVARLDEVEEPREKTFEEAKEEVLEKYIKEKSEEALKEATEEKLAAIKEAMSGGTSFAEAAKAQELTVKEHGPFGVTDRLDDEFHAREIFSSASTTNPGEIADPLYQDTRSLLVYVEKREVVKDDNRGQQVDNFANRMTDQNENAVFTGWINHQLDNTEIRLSQ